MIDLQNRFYTSISEYYHEIFPYNPVQQKFVNSVTGGVSGKKILDIGCATGELAFELAKSGAAVTGIDLNEDLLKQAEINKNHPDLNFRKGDMLRLKKDFSAKEFDHILCFGNTLVHLHSEKLVEEMLNGVFSVLKPGGYFMLQILNYDYILSEPVESLPLIETENISFIRKYIFEKNNPLVKFNTELHLKKTNTIISNETLLLTLKSSSLKNLLSDAGFAGIELYANFMEHPFGGKHIPLVAKAYKPV